MTLTAKVPLSNLGELNIQRVFVVLLSSLRPVSIYNHKICHDKFVPNPFEFTEHDRPFVSFSAK